MPRTYVALDLELTGLDRQRDEIIEVALVRFRGSEVLETFSSLVHTKRTVSPRIEQLIGLSSRDVVDAPRLEQLRGEILRFVSNYPLVAHSIETDLFFLQKQGLSLQNVALDTFELASILVPEANTYSLVSLSEMMGIALPDAHRALPDALATQALFAALVEPFRRVGSALAPRDPEPGAGIGLVALAAFAGRDPGPRDAHGHASPSQTAAGTRHSAAASSPTSPASPTMLPPLAPASDMTPIDPDPLVAAISPGGALARIFPGYEYRPQQVEMLRAVADAFNAPEHLLVEAGTGTGKSLAYLLPAIQFAVQNERRVVVSSNTINLQDQLYTKDIPDLQHLLKLPFRAALLKGRGNYLCLRRLSTFRRSRQMSIDGVRVLAKVMAWLPKTHSGDQSELLLLNSENTIWKELQATSETCIGDRCPYHCGRALLFPPGAQPRRACSPGRCESRAAVVRSDAGEPHSSRVRLCDHRRSASPGGTGHQPVRAGDRPSGCRRLSGNAEPAGRHRAPAAFLGQIPALFDAYQVSDPVRQTMADQIERMANHIDSALANLDALFRILTLFLEDYQEPGRASQGSYDRTVRITPGLRIQPGWSDIEIASDNLAAPLKQIVQGLEQLAAWITRLAR